MTESNSLRVVLWRMPPEFVTESAHAMGLVLLVRVTSRDSLYPLLCSFALTLVTRDAKSESMVLPIRVTLGTASKNVTFTPLVISHGNPGQKKASPGAITQGRRGL